MTRMLELVPRRDRFFSLIPEMGLLDHFFNKPELPDFFSDESFVVPAFDISETDKQYIITAEIPGIDVHDLHITLTNGILSVKGEKRQEREEREEKFFFAERRYGTFHRSFRIPDGIKADELEANYKDGILKIALPKTEMSEGKKINVNDMTPSKKSKSKKKN